VPLSRHTGLIEWIKNTSTLKQIVNEQWKRTNIKAEMADIKKLAKEHKGETHSDVWP
jgi:phosphatidylinositol kinase/protein kinase (PI-3  family)